LRVKGAFVFLRRVKEVKAVNEVKRMNIRFGASTVEAAVTRERSSA
jgi:hypothetical protein